MAESEGNQPDLGQEKEENLKYLDFVQVASIYAVTCLSSIYKYAKENCGPLKLGVQTVEGTVKTVIGPVYEKFQDVPLELLKFVDRKVDESIIEVERHVPSLLKHASSQAIAAAQKAPEVARAVVSEIQHDGVVDTAKNITKNVYIKYEPVAEHYAVSAWRTLNRLPLFPQVAELMIPTAAHWLHKYNQAVSYMAERNYAAATYLPLIPKDRIARIFEEDPSVSTNGEGISAAH